MPTTFSDYVSRMMRNALFPIWSYRSFSREAGELEARILRGLAPLILPDENSDLPEERLMQTHERIAKALVHGTASDLDPCPPDTSEESPKPPHDWLKVAQDEVLTLLSSPEAIVTMTILDLLRELDCMVPQEAAAKRRAWEQLKGSLPDHQPLRRLEQKRVFAIHLGFRKRALYSRYVATRRVYRLLAGSLVTLQVAAVGAILWELSRSPSTALPFSLAALGGLLGATTSLMTRLNHRRIPDYSEAVYYLIAFGWQEMLFGTLLGPALGLLFAFLVRMNLVHNWPSASPEATLLVVTGFAGGFFERLVPNLIGKLVRERSGGRT